MASRLSLVSRKVKVIQGSPGSESGVKLFLMSPLIIWKQSHVQAWPTKGVFSEVHFQYYREKNSITKTHRINLLKQAIKTHEQKWRNFSYI